MRASDSANFSIVLAVAVSCKGVSVGSLGRKDVSGTN